MRRSTSGVQSQHIRTAGITVAFGLLVALGSLFAGESLRAADENGTLPPRPNSFLPLIRIDPTPTPTPIPFPALVNGDFEQGPGKGWTEWPARLIVQTSSLPVPARSGAGGRYAAQLAGGDGQTHRLSQVVFIPYDYGNRVRLRLRSFTQSDEPTCANDRANLYLGGSTTPAQSFPLCQGQATNTWQQYVIDLSGYGGQQLELRFESVLNGSLDSHWLVDDVSLCEAGAPGCYPPRGIAISTMLTPRMSSIRP